MKAAVMAVVLSVCVTMYAKDLTLNDGTTYKDIQVTRVTPIGLEFTSDGKAGWVDFRDLPENVAKEYGYDPQKAEDFEKQIAQNQGNMVDPQGAPPSDIPQDANLDTQTVPQTPQNTQVVEPGQTVLYEPQYFPNAAPVYYGNWVNWGGRYYPYYWWHNWYWGNHWVYNNGRYYPWNYYHNHGTWYHGKYYPYHHGLLEKNRCNETKAHNMSRHPHPEYTPGRHTNYRRNEGAHAAPHATPHAAPHPAGGGHAGGGRK